MTGTLNASVLQRQTGGGWGEEVGSLRAETVGPETLGSGSKALFK